MCVCRSNGIGSQIREWPWQIPMSEKFVLESSTVSWVRRKTWYYVLFLRSKKMKVYLPIHFRRIYLHRQCMILPLKASSYTLDIRLFSSLDRWCLRSGSHSLNVTHYNVIIICYWLMNWYRYHCKQTCTILYTRHTNHIISQCKLSVLLKVGDNAPNPSPGASVAFGRRGGSGIRPEEIWGPMKRN